MVMFYPVPDFVPALPEIVLSAAILVIVLIDAFLPEAYRAVTYRLSLAALALTGYAAYAVSAADVRLTFEGAFVADAMSDALKIAICALGGLIFLYSRDYLREIRLFKGEFYVICLLGILGMMIMTSAHSLLTVYLGLELLSFSLYALTAMRRDDGRASEAAMKYFVLGALASGLLLYGLSMVYGATGHLELAAIADAIAEVDAERALILVFGLVFVVVGVAFKLGAVPFHMWVPDVYQGAPVVVTMFISSAPKLAAFALAMRLLVEAMGALSEHWAQMLLVLAVLSLIIGNVVAIAQHNIKRMLAYSTIAHVGFIVMGMLSGNGEGYAAAMFYVITYALMATAGFAVLTLLSRNGEECETLDHIKGMNQRYPWLAFLMLLVMFSMAGVPPTVGFYAKLLVLQSVVGAGLLPLAIAAVVFSVIGAFYYLRVVKLMYFDSAEQDAAVIAPSTSAQTALSINALGLLALGLFPAALMQVCVNALG